MTQKAVVLLSGGLDSTTTLAFAQSQGFACYALSFRYGQRHAAELAAARTIAIKMGVAEHIVANIDLRAFGGSALTDDIDVPKDRPLEDMSEGIPVTYVPARNTIFLAFALGWADVLNAQDIYIGVNALDYSGYPDCRPEFIEAFNMLANLAVKSGTKVSGKLGRGIRVHAPLIRKTKAEIITLGTQLGVDYSQTSSCYDPDADGNACGHCDSCLLRLKGFREAGYPDPRSYVEDVA